MNAPNIEKLFNTNNLRAIFKYSFAFLFDIQIHWRTQKMDVELGANKRKRKKVTTLKSFFTIIELLIGILGIRHIEWMPASKATSTTSQYWWTFFFVCGENLFLSLSSLCFLLKCPFCWIAFATVPIEWNICKEQKLLFHIVLWPLKCERLAYDNANGFCWCVNGVEKFNEFLFMRLIVTFYRSCVGLVTVN